jgi:hypothetical protein
MERSPRQERVEVRKGQAIEALSDQYAKSAMPLEEYERMVEYINKVESDRELMIVERMIEETARYAETDKPRGRTEESPGAYPREYPREHGRSYQELLSQFTILSSRESRGDLIAGEKTSLVTLLGSRIIRIEEGDLPPGPTVLDVVTILGSVEITVPPGVAVNMQAVAVLGDTHVGRTVNRSRLPGQPELVITGAALLGSIAVRLRKEGDRLKDLERRRRDHRQHRDR